MKKLLTLSILGLALSANAAVNFDSPQRSAASIPPDYEDYLNEVPDAEETPASIRTAEPRLSIQAEALGGVNALSHMNDGYDTSRSVSLILNNDKDRAGAEVSACQGPATGDDMPSCDSLRFVFPQLVVNRETKQVLLGNEVVATFGGFFGGLRMNKAFKLVMHFEKTTIDSGFNRKLVDVYSVTLERNN